jgi:hypothetical protein
VFQAPSQATSVTSELEGMLNNGVKVRRMSLHLGVEVERQGSWRQGQILPFLGDDDGVALSQQHSSCSMQQIVGAAPMRITLASSTSGPAAAPPFCHEQARSCSSHLRGYSRC